MPDKKEPTEKPITVYKANLEAEPVPIAELLMATGELSEQVPAENLVDTTFYIVALNRFESKFEGQENPFHCICREEESREFFRTVLGGTAVIRHLQAICDLGIKNPIKVTLRFVDGGRYGGYYVLE